jgi:predicted ATP-grasp superfamily ATP-dependent carboligase
VDRTRTDAVELDRSVAALLVKVGRYPIHHGGLNAMRSLGRLGVPVFALSSHRFTPAVWSRYLTRRIDWSATGSEEPEQLIPALRAVGRELGRQTVAIPGDDEAAVLLAEHADELREHFLLPRVAPGLPREVASKRGLYQHCLAHGIPTPRTVFPTSLDEVVSMARELTYPVIAKNVAPWQRIRRPLVPGTTVVHDERELLARFGSGRDLDGLLFQEYLPYEHGDDWFVHVYCDTGGACLVNISGRKLRSWPPGTGSTAYASAEHNPVLVGQIERLTRAIGWQGISSVDARFDRRDGQYKVVDFNPRMGAQFIIARTETGIDVVRALHLHLTGRPVPPGSPDQTRRVIVEDLDYKARVAYRWRGLPTTPAPRGTRAVRAWWAADDPLPYPLMLLRSGFGLVAGPVRQLRAGLRRTGRRDRTPVH